MTTETKDRTAVLAVGSKDQELPSHVEGETSPGPRHGFEPPKHTSSLHTISGHEPLPIWRSALVYTSLCLALLLSVMDLTIVTTALYDIALDFGSLADSYWIILAYSLTELGFTVISTHLSNFLGRRPTLLLSLALFFAFSIGAGFATSLTQLICFRALQGLGAAGMYALSMVIMIEISTPRMLPFIGGVIGGVVGFSGVLGPVIGGLLTRYVSWRWIFWITAPVSLLAMLLFVLALPSSFYTSRLQRQPARDFDFVGAALLLAASVLLVFGLQQCGIGALAWDSAAAVATLTIGGVCWLALAAWEWSMRRKPHASVLPLSSLDHPSIAAGILVTLLSGFVFFAIVFLLPLRLQIVNRDTPSTAGLHMLPLLFSAGVGSFVAGGLCKKLDNTCITFIVGTALIVLGTGLLTTLSSSLKIQNKLYGFEVLLGLGVGMIFSSISVTVSIRVQPHFRSVIQGIAAQARLLGGSIGVAAANAVTARKITSMLKGVLTPLQISSVQFDTSVLGTLNSSEKEDFRVAWANGWNEMTKLCLYMALVAFAVSLFTLASIRVDRRRGIDGVRETKD